jgi:hypothetical protein
LPFVVECLRGEGRGRGRCGGRRKVCSRKMRGENGKCAVGVKSDVYCLPIEVMHFIQIPYCLHKELTKEVCVNQSL